MPRHPPSKERLREGFQAIPWDWIERTRRGEITTEQLGMLVLLVAESQWAPRQLYLPEAGGIVELQRGQVITTERSAAERWRLGEGGRDRVHRAFARFDAIGACEIGPGKAAPTPTPGAAPTPTPTKRKAAPTPTLVSFCRDLEILAPERKPHQGPGKAAPTPTPEAAPTPAPISTAYPPTPPSPTTTTKPSSARVVVEPRSEALAPALTPESSGIDDLWSALAGQEADAGFPGAARRPPDFAAFATLFLSQRDGRNRVLFGHRRFLADARRGHLSSGAIALFVQPGVHGSRIPPEPPANPPVPEPARAEPPSEAPAAVVLELPPAVGPAAAPRPTGPCALCDAGAVDELHGTPVCRDCKREHREKSGPEFAAELARKRRGVDLRPAAAPPNEPPQGPSPTAGARCTPSAPSLLNGRLAEVLAQEAPRG